MKEDEAKTTWFRCRWKWVCKSSMNMNERNRWGNQEALSWMKQEDWVD